MFTKEELDYIEHLVDESLWSLDDICDRDGQPTVDWMSAQEAQEEYTLIESIINKIKMYKSTNFEEVMVKLP